MRIAVWLPITTAAIVPLLRVDSNRHTAKHSLQHGSDSSHRIDLCKNHSRQGNTPRALQCCASSSFSTTEMAVHIISLQMLCVYAEPEGQVDVISTVRHPHHLQDSSTAHVSMQFATFWANHAILRYKLIL